MPQNKSNIELRSEEVQEILGQVPHWIIRRGITLIFVVVILLIVGSYFFRYPDIINSRLILTTQNPPAELVAKVSGKIDHLFVEEKQQVDKGTVLAILENPALLSDVDSLSYKIEGMKMFFTDFAEPERFEFSKNYRLGEIQESYATFLKHFSDYQNFFQLEYHTRKIASKKDQVSEYNLYYNRLYVQRNILEKELGIVRQQLIRDSLLYVKGVLALDGYQKSQKAFLQQRYAFHGARTTLANTQISISDLKQEILDLEMQRVSQIKSMQNELIQTYDNLKAQVDMWEQKYLLRAPIGGTITFNKFWSSNQNVTIGDRVLTVIPRDSTRLIARVDVGLSGAGKVKVGQRVNIKLDNYPYMEYGMLEGEIETISQIPDGQLYSCEVRLSRGLTTNYGKTLGFSQKMEGNAEIITEDICLLQRVFNPIRALFAEHI